jgi:hypothetical protein
MYLAQVQHLVRKWNINCWAVNKAKLLRRAEGQRIVEGVVDFNFFSTGGW